MTEQEAVLKHKQVLESWFNEDKFPDNKDEWYDSDYDDIGDNEDTDDDNDGVPDKGGDS